MFEKEAEEILNNHCDCELLSECMTGIRCRCSDFEDEKKLLLEGIELGYSKANEWHKVADGDLPKENNLYLVAIKDNGLAIAYFNGLHWETKFNLGDFGHCLETVIAWCEIPKFEEK